MNIEELRLKATRKWHSFDSIKQLRIVVGGGTCGRAAGALEVIDIIRSRLKKKKIMADIVEVGCLGMCYAEVIVEVARPDGPRIVYKNISPENAAKFAADCVINNHLRRDLALATTGDLYVEGLPRFEDLTMINRQVRIALRNCGWIDPLDIDHYIARGGYYGLSRAISLSPREVITEVKRSGLRGRGGAGFPTGVKWEFCANAKGDQKYLICNADEGDPGAFMDRSVLESDPHALLEGMVIAAYAIGASEGYIYVRAEYPLAIERLKLGISDMYKYGLLGDSIQGTGFSFHIKIKEGAGAFVCGEETALIASIEGKRGMPVPRPPFPATSGLFGKPTNINNVETFANVSAILAKGSKWYAQYGTEKSKGTKTFALAGKINRTGLIEVPLGIPLRDIIYDIGGGIPNGKKLKGVQTGGPSGGCIPASQIDLPVDYEALAEAGSIMGSGGMIIMDEDTCMVDIARYFVEFTKVESCGKCTPCRIGTAEMLSILERICAGEGKPKDIDLLTEIGNGIKATALCGLGQTAPNPVLTTLQYFHEEYREHIEQKKCRAVVCKKIVEAPCKHTCPANVDVPRYIRYIGQKRYTDALNVVREKIPFPFVCGRVCFHPCETKCRRGQIDEPIAIRMLKRVATDLGLPFIKSRIKGKKDKRIAVIGSGPCGLTAGYYLQYLGYKVTVFEALSHAGGMMWTGIPEFRLPRKILQREIESLGLTIKLDSPVTSIARLQEIYDAVVIATGAHRGSRLHIPGEDLDGVTDSVEYLRQVNSGRKAKTGKQVVVIGGGNAAIDTARTAVRQGAQTVIIAYRRTEKQMPASTEEIAEAKQEKINFQFLVEPRRIEKVNGRLRITLQKMKAGPVDADGRMRPVPVEGKVAILVADTLISAIGQLPVLPSSMPPVVDKWGRITVNKRNGMTKQAGLFAGGDVVLGSSSIIEAIAEGRRLASGIDRYFGGDGNIEQVFAPAEDKSNLKVIEPESIAARVRIPTIALKDRTLKREVELCLSQSAAIKETKRCLNCDLEE